ncbi:hypothetical protein BASA81_005512 [Batrachochytrium salamandrivorans]|nr:hypothetical protein BASA81_005512 [Batrachochytrium salamandrivorans]
MTARLSSFFVGAATGSLYYYGVTYSMLHNVSKADKRVVEIREELIGMVAVPAQKAKGYALSAILTPLQPLQSWWNNSVHTATSSISGVISSKQNSPTPATPTTPTTPTTTTPQVADKPAAKPADAVTVGQDKQ